MDTNTILVILTVFLAVNSVVLAIFLFHPPGSAKRFAKSFLSIDRSLPTTHRSCARR